MTLSVFLIDGGYAGASWQPKEIETYMTDIEAFADPNFPPKFTLNYKMKEVGDKNNIFLNTKNTTYFIVFRHAWTVAH